MKRLTAILFAALLLFSSCGTAVRPGTGTGETAPAVSEEGLVRLSFFERSGLFDAIAPAGEDRFVFLFREEKGGDHERKLFLADASRDVLLAESAPIGAGEDLLGVRKNGEVITADPAEGVIRLYKEDLTFDRSAALPEECRRFSFDPGSDRIVAVSETAVYTVSPDGAAEKAFTPESGVFVLSFDPVSKIALCMHPYPETGVYAYDCAAKKTVVSSARAGIDSMIRDGVFVSVCDRAVAESETGIFTHRILTVHDASGSPVSAFDLGREYQVAWPSGTSFAVGIRAADPDNVWSEKQTAVIFDFANGAVAVPDLGMKSPTFLRSAYLSGTGTFILAASGLKDDGNPGVVFTKVDPAALEWTEKLSAAAPDTAENALASVRENEAMLRRLADEIEAEYPVRIFLGDDCLAVSGTGIYSFSSTSAAAEDESPSVALALAALRRVLAVYPKETLERLRDGVAEGGLYFYLVEEILSDSSRYFADGLSFVWGARQNVALEVRSFKEATQDAVVHHELWHTLERVMSSSADCRAFDEGSAWNGLNPDDFSYTYDLETYAEEAAKWSRYFLNGEDPYFIDDYSTHDPKEDRAELIEALFKGTFASTLSASLEKLEKYPHLKAKLDYMAREVKAYFGIVYWEDAAARG